MAPLPSAAVRIGRVAWKPGMAPATPRPRANGGGPDYPWPGALPLSSGFAYEAESLFSEELGTWSPWLRSADTELDWYRDRRVARSRDLERNDGWARGAITRATDDTIGHQFRLVARPHWRLLQRMAPECDQVWAQEFADAVEAEWSAWAEDPLFWCDAARSGNFVQLMRLQLRHKLIDGENLHVHLWTPDKVGLGAARYATRVQLIDPDRLSNPYDMPDTHDLRGGIEIDNDGAAVAYHVRRAHQFEMYDADKTLIWDRIPRETEWGRPIVVHDRDPDRVAQHRGLGVLIPVLKEFKQLARYDQAEIAQALLQTAIGTFIESPFDPDQLRMAMEAPQGTEGGDLLNAYQAARDAFHGEHRLSVGTVRIPTLVPGEKIAFSPPRHPSTNFDAFEHAVLRKVASAIGTTAEQITQDYSKANYSSLRAALLSSWRTMLRRRADFGAGTATPTYVAVLEEILDRNPSLLPRRAPDFMEMRAAYARCRWIGPGRGWIDPVKERQGAVLGLDAGFGTLEDECAELSGGDWRETIEQRAQEVQEFKRLGLKLPDWAGVEDASEAAKKPLAE